MDRISMRTEPVRGLESSGFVGFTIDADGLPILAIQEPFPQAPYSPRRQLDLVHGWPPRLVRAIRNPGVTFPLVQPYRGGWLLVDSRCVDNVPNGWVLSARGRLLDRILLHDAVEDVQVDEVECVWVSRFDEAWEYRVEVFDSAGVRRSDFDLDIMDCYAMNVVSAREVWLCYYTDFPVVAIRDGVPTEVLAEAPVAGSHALAVAGDLLLFAQGYDDGHLTVANHRTGEVVCTVLPVVDDKVLSRGTVRARGRRMYFLTDRGIAGVELCEDAPHVVAL